MKPKTLSRMKKFAIGTLMLGIAVIQPVNALPDSSPFSTVVTAEAASKVKLTKTKISLNKGKSYNLKLTGTTKKVSWSSSNKKVATVSSKGKVTAKKKGTATITAKVGTKKYKCKVTVKQPVTSVKLNKKAYTLKKKGATVTLKATVKPTNANNRKVKWTTSDKKVATVTSKGVVKAVGNGTAVITATAADGSKKKASCKVTVSIPAATVKVAAVSLNKTSATLTAKDQAVNLTATVSPSNASNKSVTWTSSNTSVATVSNGVVTAVGNGTATITVTTADGAKKATCMVKVDIPAPIIKVTSITLDKSSATLTAKGQTVALTASVTPSNAANKAVTWSSSNAGVATVSNGTVTAVSNGTAAITATAADGSGKSASCTITVNIPVKVTEVSLDKTAATLTAKGQTVVLTASVTPGNASNKGVTWSSSNAGVATVANGTVTAVANGTTTITATAADGSGKQATCAITVNIPATTNPSATNVSLAGGSSTTLSLYASTYTLNGVSLINVPSTVNIDNVTFELSGNANVIETGSTSHDAGLRTQITVRALKTGNTQVLAKYNGATIYTWNITVTSNWSVYTAYRTWINSVESQIWTSGMSTVQKLDAIQSYIQSNFHYGGSDGYCEYQTMTADCWGASRMFGTMASDLGVTVGYVNKYTGQVYEHLSTATGAAAGHVYTVVLINGQWVNYDSTPPY